MLTLYHEKSYLWIFPIFCLLFFGSAGASLAATGNPNWSFITLPLFGLWLLTAQLKSGVALDSWWKATHLRGTTEYQYFITWNVLWLLLATGLAGFAIAS